MGLKVILRLKIGFARRFGRAKYKIQNSEFLTMGNKKPRRLTGLIFIVKSLIEFVSVFRRMSEDFFAGEHARNFAFAFHELSADDHIEMPNREEDYEPCNVVMNVMAHHFGADECIYPAE